MEEEVRLEIQKYTNRNKDATDMVKLLLDHQKFGDAVSKAFYSILVKGYFFMSCPDEYRDIS